jgi:hypothetical protein
MDICDCKNVRNWTANQSSQTEEFYIKNAISLPMGGEERPGHRKGLLKLVAAIVVIIVVIVIIIAVLMVGVPTSQQTSNVMTAKEGKAVADGIANSWRSDSILSGILGFEGHEYLASGPDWQWVDDYVDTSADTIVGDGKTVAWRFIYIESEVDSEKELNVIVFANGTTMKWEEDSSSTWNIPQVNLDSDEVCNIAKDVEAFSEFVDRQRDKATFKIELSPVSLEWKIGYNDDTIGYGVVEILDANGNIEHHIQS